MWKKSDVLFIADCDEKWCGCNEISLGVKFCMQFTALENDVSLRHRFKLQFTKTVCPNVNGAVRSRRLIYTPGWGTSTQPDFSACQLLWRWAREFNNG